MSENIKPQPTPSEQNFGGWGQTKEEAQERLNKALLRQHHERLNKIGVSGKRASRVRAEADMQNQIYKDENAILKAVQAGKISETDFNDIQDPNLREEVRDALIEKALRAEEEPKTESQKEARGRGKAPEEKAAKKAEAPKTLEDFELLVQQHEELKYDEEKIISEIKSEIGPVIQRIQERSKDFKKDSDREFTEEHLTATCVLFAETAMEIYIFNAANKDLQAAQKSLQEMLSFQQSQERIRKAEQMLQWGGLELKASGQAANEEDINNLVKRMEETVKQKEQIVQGLAKGATEKQQEFQKKLDEQNQALNAKKQETAGKIQEAQELIKGMDTKNETEAAAAQALQNLIESYQESLQDFDELDEAVKGVKQNVADSAKKFGVDAALQKQQKETRAREKEAPAKSKKQEAETPKTDPAKTEKPAEEKEVEKGYDSLMLEAEAVFPSARNALSIQRGEKGFSFDELHTLDNLVMQGKDQWSNDKQWQLWEAVWKKVYELNKDSFVKIHEAELKSIVDSWGKDDSEKQRAWALSKLVYDMSIAKQQEEEPKPAA